VTTDAEAEALARRPTAQAACLIARAAAAAAAARSAAGWERDKDNVSFNDEDGSPRRPRLPPLAAAMTYGLCSSGAGREGGDIRRVGSCGGREGSGGSSGAPCGGRGGGCGGRADGATAGGEISHATCNAEVSVHGGGGASAPHGSQSLTPKIPVVACRTAAECILPHNRVLTPAPAPGNTHVGLQVG